MTETRISSAAVARLIRSSREFLGNIEASFQGAPDGWHWAPYCPEDLLRCFPRLRLRPDVRLVSYQYMKGGNGNGFVFAIPAEKEPLPAEMIGMVSGYISGAHLFDQPQCRPPEWYDPQIEKFLIGDGSPQSYFEASLFSREVRELGACWHGGSWSSHKLLTSKTGAKSAGRREGDGKCTWEEPEPKDWRPCVRVADQQAVTVEFFSYSGLGGQAIYRHTDTFRDGYTFSTDCTVVARGSGGYVY